MNVACMQETILFAVAQDQEFAYKLEQSILVVQLGW